MWKFVNKLINVNFHGHEIPLMENEQRSVGIESDSLQALQISIVDIDSKAKLNNSDNWQWNQRHAFTIKRLKQ